MKSLIILIAITLGFGAIPESNNNFQSSIHEIEKEEQSQKISIPVLMYHHLDPKISNYTTVTPSDFDKQMAYLSKQNYTSITTNDLDNFIYKNGKLPKKPILITFDDGYESNYVYAYPVLKKYNMKATIFLIVERMGKKVNGTQRLSWKQSKEMYASGLVDFQSHTYNLHHQVDQEGNKKAALLARIEIDGVEETEEKYKSRICFDLLKSKFLIEKNIGNKVVSIAFPYGSYDKTILELVSRTGFTTAFTTNNGIVTVNSNPVELNRINVAGGFDGRKLVNEIKEASTKR